jgi:flagellar protein FlaG
MASNDMSISTVARQLPATPLAAPVKNTTPAAVKLKTSDATQQITKAQDNVRQARAQSSEALQKIQADLQEAVDKLANAIESSPTSTKIKVDNELDRFVMQVTDKQTGEIIREIPGEAVLKIARSLENLRGILYDSKA